MKKRGKTGKKSKLFSKRIDSVSSEDEQVSVSSSLPPSVEGQIRCFLTLSVSKFTWAMEKHPDDVNIRIRWWGEQGQGALLRPVRKAQERLTVESRWMSVRYPVCSGPKQFAAYLNDMGCLVVETVHASTHIPFGKALVSEITQLAASHPVNVVVPVMSVISPFNKLADIQVFIKFESISAAYNKVYSTIPTVDTGLDKENVDISNPDPTPPPYLNPATPVTHPKHQRDANDPFESPANPIKGVKFSEDPPQRLEYSQDPSLLSMVENELNMSEYITSSNRQLHNPSEINRELDLSQQAFISGNEANLTNQNYSMPASHENGQHLGDKTTMDWISALLEKGQRLRDGLALSALLDDTSVTMNEEHSPPESHVLPGHLFQAILSPEKTSSHQLQLMDSSNEEIVGDGDMVVNLLMGDNSGIDLLSDISEDLSEIGDPLHDDSLLMDLFYKQDDKSGGNESDGTISTDEEDNHPVNIPMNDGDKSVGNESDVRVSADEEDNHQVNIPMNDGEKGIKVKQFMKDTLKSEELLKRDNSTEEDSDRPDVQQETEVHTEEMSPRDSNDMIHKLGTDTLTTLGRVNTARVVIEKLQLTDPKVVKRQNSSKKQSTFFFEYHFPISTRDATGKVSVVRELTRAASKKLLNDVVTFNHRSVFPISFDASVLEQWWGLNLIFRVLKRQSIQKVPEELGVGVLPLKTVLSSKNLSHASLIEVMEHSNKIKVDTASLSSWQKAEEESLHSNIIGNIEVKIELGLDGKQLLYQTSSTSSRDSVTCPQQIQSNVVMVSQPSAVIKSGTKHAKQSDTHRDAMNIVISKPPLPKQSQSHVIKLHEPEEPADMLTLHSLLWIPEGKGISSQVADNSGRTGNLFLVSRMFWCDEVSKSPIYWGITNNPHLGYKQVAPVLLTPTLLQRTCNNFMVIEVWNKAVPQGEMLIGITKLPLHQFYLSFRDSKITKTLIKSKFPVICVDELIPIINPFTTQSHGELKVLLAMGTQEQIAYLLEIKGGGQTSSVLHNKENHLHRNREQCHTNAMHSLKKNFSIVEHQFEITIEDIRGLSIFKSTIWGETDCYVQYHFPSQVKNSDVLDNEVVPDLKSYHTCTTLCVPDPSFQDTTRHSFVLPSGVPVQRYLLAAYSGSWMNVSSIPGSGGVPFELWRRYYYPNVRDQLVTKASLPVAKLCAMVTMKRQREPSIQTFSLPLTVLPEEDKATEHNMIEESGLLNLAIKYQENKIHSTDDKPKLDSNQVCLSVDIIRICGLKDAAKLHATATPSMSYPADVGVNTYVVIKLPIGKKAQHVTRTVARTFAPEFSYHIEIGAPLQMSRKPSEKSIISLAEKLEMSEAVFEIWHQDCRGFGAIQEQQDKPHQTKPNKYDVFMGVVKVPLVELVTHRTGIRGWHPIKPAIANHHGDHTVLGGLQLSIKFEDPEDRENVIHAGRNLGWSPPFGVDDDDDDEELKGLDMEDEDDDSGQTSKGLELSVKMDRALVSRSLIDDLKGLPDQSHLDIKGYVRYKLYDKSPICSGMVCIRPSEKNMFLLDIKHSRCFVIPVTSSLLWYLREEKLEVQVWFRGQAKQSKEIATLPGQRDKLIGSAFINLSALVSKGLLYQSQTSGTFPLFKAGADTIDGACVCVQISLATPTARSHNYDKMGEYITVDHSISSDDYPSTKGYNDDDDDDNDKSSTCTKTIDKGHNLKTKSCMDDVDTFTAHIIIQEARHLNSVAGPGSQRVSPNAYVTYQISPSTLEVTTPVYQSSFCPLWEYQKLERLPSFILKTQNLIFKVWHKAENNENQRNSGSTPASGDDVALGFASVDLKPLAAGLRQLIGWYNIMDFSGECKGQIKVSHDISCSPNDFFSLDNVGVVPLTPVVSSSHCLPKSRIHTGSSLTTINKVPVPFYTDNKEWQEQFQADDLVSVQKHSNSESLWRIGSVDISPLTEEISTTRPVTTSTSLLFKQLRENMKDLDDLQKRFQAKLCARSSGAGVIGELHFSEGMSSSMKLHAEQIPDDNDNLKSFNFNMKDLEREEQLLQYRKQTLDASEASSPFGKCGEGYKIVREKPSTSNEKLFEKIPQLGQIVTKKEDLSSHHPSSNSDKEAIDEALDNAAGEDTLTELVEVTNSSQDHDDHMLVTTAKETSEKLCTPSESDLEEYMGADSIEDSTYHETKIECPSEPGFMQERDSWLSSPEEDETEKLPLNSTDYSLDSGNQYRTDEEESDGKRETSNKSYKLNVVTVNSSSEDYKDQTFKEEHEEIDKHPLKACLYKGDSDCMQKDCFGEIENEHPQTSGYEISNSIPCTQKDNKLSYLPNFFMPTQQLENSMRALRLGTKVIASSTLHNHPQSRLLQRTFDTKSRGTGSNRIMNQFSQKKTIYKAKKDGHPPLSAAEIERIARIFSSKDA